MNKAFHVIVTRLN